MDRETVHEVSRRDWMIHKNHTIFTLSRRERNFSRPVHGDKLVIWQSERCTRGQAYPRVGSARVLRSVVAWRTCTVAHVSSVE